MINIAINGYGRIGKNILRALYESDHQSDIKIVAINDLGDIASLAHITKYDSTHGRFSESVAVDGDHLVINGDRIHVLSERDPAKLPWKELNVDVVHEATGFFTSKEKATLHIQAGAKKVLISAPGQNVDVTVVYGVNHQDIKPSDTIISNASCTTNCLAPLCKVLHQSIGIASGTMTTVHSYTNDQVLNDVYHKDLRRGRAAAISMIPTKTGAMEAVALVLPALAGRLDGYSVRVPTNNVSMVDLVFIAERETSVDEINALFAEAASGDFSKILQHNIEPLVSSDFNHNTASSIFDATLTRVIQGKLVKVVAWYDNEWGFANRMLDSTTALV